MLMNLKTRTLSTETENYQEIFFFLIVAFQIIVAIFKINSIDFGFFVFIYIFVVIAY